MQHVILQNIEPNTKPNLRYSTQGKSLLWKKSIEKEEYRSKLSYAIL